MKKTTTPISISIGSETAVGTSEKAAVQTYLLTLIQKKLKLPDGFSTSIYAHNSERVLLSIKNRKKLLVLQAEVSLEDSCVRIAGLSLPLGNQESLDELADVINEKLQFFDRQCLSQT